MSRLRGDETVEELEKLKTIDHAFVMLDVPSSISRLHSSRRVFSIFGEKGIDSSVIHALFPLLSLVWYIYYIVFARAL